MRKLAKLAICMMALGAVAISHSQDNFPDVPKGHWAYKEVSELRKAGLLKGYPDGLFRGGRPASRFELAVAAHAAWSRHKQEVDGLNKALIDALHRAETPKTRVDPKNLEAALLEVKKQKDLNQQDIATLQQLMKELEPELKRLKVEIEKARIANLGKRVDGLEKRKSGG